MKTTILKPDELHGAMWLLRQMYDNAMFFRMDDNGIVECLKFNSPLVSTVVARLEVKV